MDVAGIYNPESGHYIFEEQRISAFRIFSKFLSKNKAACESGQEFQHGTFLTRKTDSYRGLRAEENKTSIRKNLLKYSAIYESTMLVVQR